MTQPSDLTAWRKARGIKAKEVAEFLGYTIEHISRVETGKRSLGTSAWRLLEGWKP
jgi:transcriptional regulator with XRE-family HTH domain